MIVVTSKSFSEEVLLSKIPVIALTSLDYESITKEDRDFFDYYLTKPAPDNLLYRTVSKFISGFNETMQYLGDASEYILELKNKKILFVICFSGTTNKNCS